MLSYVFITGLLRVFLSKLRGNIDQVESKLLNKLIFTEFHVNIMPSEATQTIWRTCKFVTWERY